MALQHYAQCGPTQSHSQHQIVIQSRDCITEYDITRYTAQGFTVCTLLNAEGGDFIWKVWRFNSAGVCIVHKPEIAFKVTQAIEGAGRR